MGYSREVYDKVEKKLYNMRTQAQEQLDVRKSKFYDKFPRAKEIESLLSSTSIKAARAVLGGANTRNIISDLKNKNQKLREELNEIISRAGLPKNYLELHYSCFKCHDEGFIDGKMCNCMKEMLKKESCEILGNISPLENSGFESFDLNYYPDYSLSDNRQSPKEHMSRVLKYCEKYSKGFNRHSSSLLFAGNTGLGKTHISLSIAKKVIEKGYSVVYTSVQNMVSKIERERFKFNQDGNGVEHSFIDCDLLIMDDLGTEFSTTFSSASLYNILDMRISLRKPTIISTTLSMDEISKRYTKQLVSRIIGSYIRLNFIGQDIRQKRINETYGSL